MNIRLVLFLAVFPACNPSGQPAAPTTPAPAAGNAPSKGKFPVHCFEIRESDGSVLSFQYTEYYDQIVGILDYSFYDKDGAHGTFEGKKEGDIIAATWSYTIEGSPQKEKILIRIDGDRARRAQGELTEEKDGTLRLKNPSAATWDEVFTRVQCD